MIQVEIIEAKNATALRNRTNEALKALSDISGVTVISVRSFGFAVNHDAIDKRLYSQITYEIRP